MFNRILTTLCLISSLVAGSAIAQCTATPGFNNALVVTEGVWEVTFVTEKTTYTLGDQVPFELIIRNTGTTSARLNWPVDTPEAVFVAPSTCLDPVACTDDFVFDSPYWRFYVPGSLTLAPGECHYSAATWDTATNPATPGLYTAWGGLFAWSVDTPEPIGDWLLPVNGAPVSFELLDAVPNAVTTFGQLKATYR